ncbi:hypothetical protein ACSRUE_25365 [Sorangium sp. KYC3313]|uniref:hypothetical protein n=1 Tax=Sorangium sp. KYC3313 TaxID=3449740 RepID=UPI003F8B6995
MAVFLPLRGKFPRSCKLRSKLWAFNGSSAEAKNLVPCCYTENVPGDTIVVMRHHNKVHGCTVTNSPPVSTAFNGILVYGGYGNVEITGNARGVPRS